MTRLIDPDESLVAHRSRADWIVAFAIVAVCIVTSVVSTTESALCVAATVGVLAAAVQQKWSSRRHPRMWLLAAVVAAIQIPAIVLVPLPQISVSIAVVPFMVIEALALLALLKRMERHSPRSSPETVQARDRSAANCAVSPESKPGPRR